jgi:diguanylate cyclase (GGDEF)-like protein
VAGATIGLLSLLLPVSRRANIAGLYSNVGLAYAGGALLIGCARRARGWMLHVALAIGALLIGRAVLLSGETVSFYSVWFIWVGIYAFSFFGRRAAACHMAWVCVLYAATLIHDPPSSPVARWLTTVSTLIVAGIFIGHLVGRIRSQAHAAAADAHRMVQLADLAHQLAALSDGLAARTALSEGARHVIDADRCSLWEPTADELGLRMTASAGIPACVTETALDAGESKLITAFRTGQPAMDSAATAAGSENGPQNASDTRVWQPIVHESRTIAVLELAWMGRALREDPSLLAIAALLGIEAAVTLQRVELLETLETIARTDELTGLPNRRAWHEQLPLELARVSRASESLSVAMIDLDYFKHYNDSHGHDAGDRLLKQVASLWNDELRETDLLTRYGGEEFALALPACPLNQALAIIERFRAAIPDSQSCSAGVAAWDGTETAAALLQRADRALYDAKRTGRNRTALATPQPLGVQGALRDDM